MSTNDRLHDTTAPSLSNYALDDPAVPPPPCVRCETTCEWELCGDCQGTGFAPFGQGLYCPACQGNGGYWRCPHCEGVQ